MMVHQTPTEDISQLRQKLALVKDRNNALKQRLRAKEDALERHVKKLKSTEQECQSVQKQLHSYAGAAVTVKDDALEISFTPICCGIPQSPYKMVLGNIQSKSWQVAGYNLPISVYRKPGSRLLSEKKLAKFIQGVSQEVLAYSERKYQVLETEKILEKVPGASIWYSTKFQKVFLTLPIKSQGREENFVGQVTLDYEVDHILPLEVDTKAQGLDEKHLETLGARFREFFLHFSLLAVIKEEFEYDCGEDGSMILSIASSVSQ